ncbi:ABC transporter permease [Mycoplasmatota bacterium]|nr:ABC transporter permease [Mycoplasmatota bacterium]
MRIILKFLLRNIFRKKLRTLLILFSITLSTALVFSTLAISDTVKNFIVDDLRKYTGSSEIIIQKDMQSLSNPFFEMQEVEDNQIEYMVGCVKGSAVYPLDDELQIYIAGYELEDLEKMFEISFEERESNSFTGDQVIIGRGEATELGVNVGDTIQLMINKEVKDFTIYGITKPQGLFNYNGQQLTIILPRDTLASFYDASTKINTVYVKTTSSENVNEVIDKLNEVFKDDFIVKTTITMEEIDENVRSLTTAFSFMLILVILISIFIIYTSFKVITMERLPMVGTFRSIGATKKTTNLILLGESIIYGTIGGLFGCILGFGILNFMMNTMAYNPYTGVTVQGEMIYSLNQLLFAFIFSIVLSFVSSLIPIAKVSNMPLRNIVLNNIRKVVKRRNYKGIIGFILLVTPLVILNVSNQISESVALLSFISITISIIMLVPFISAFFVFLFGKTSHYLFKNEGIIACKNLRRNKNIINNITLLTVGIASLLMINTVSHSILNEIVNVFDDAKFEVHVIHPKADQTIINRLESIPGIESDDVGKNYSVYNVKLTEKNDYVNYVWGINPDEYFKFWDVEFIQDKEELLNQLGEDRFVIPSLVLKQKFNLQVGDTITLNLKNGSFSYEIIGFAQILLNNGDFIYVHENYLKQDAGLNYYSDIMIKTKNPKDIENRIKKEFESERIRVSLLDDAEQENKDSNRRTFVLLSGFSVITLIIGIFGVFNNLIVSLLSRKRSLAIYRSVGMSKKQVMKMLMIESLGSGMIAGITGLCAGILYIYISSYIMEVFMLPIQMDYSIELLVFAFLGGILVSILSAIIPSIKSSKLNIIEAIKYE